MGPILQNISIRELTLAKVIAPVTLVYVTVPFPRGFKKAAKKVNCGSFTNLLSSLNPNKFILLKQLLGHFHSCHKKVLVYFEYVVAVHAYAIALECPFITGGQLPHRKRFIKNFKMARDAATLLVTRIADSGLDVPDLAVGIQVDGHGASRQQEVQRVGRLQRQK